jgi:hypothetical protein
MPLYFGIPVCLDELMKLLDISFLLDENEKCMSREEYISRNYYKLLKIVEMEVKSKMTDISIHHTDKGQIILGYQVEGVNNISNNIIDIDDFTILMIRLKRKFEEEIVTFNIVNETVDLFRIENAPILNRKLKPYLIFYN